MPYCVDRGTTSLAQGDLVRGGSKTLPTLRTPVTRGESISFIVGPTAPTKPGCDATQLEVTIATQRVNSVRRPARESGGAGRT